MSQTTEEFQALLNTMGSPVTYHREEGGAPCPCLSPEGFRSPAWHRDLSHLNDDVDILIGALLNDYADASQAFAVILYVSAVDPGNEADLGRWVYVQGDNHVGDNYPGTDTAEEMQALIVAGTTGLAVGDNIVLVKSVVGTLAEPIWVFASKPGVGVLADVALTYPLDTLLAPVSPYAPVCNENGVLAPDITEVEVRAAVQPVRASRRRGAVERATELFGEIEQDDHMGFFPVLWEGNRLDFSTWSEAGEDYVLYDNRRFFVVAADKLPDVDGDPDHHWEVALRLLSPAAARPV